MLKRSETDSPRAQPTSLADTITSTLSTLNAEVVTPWRYHSTMSQQSWQQSHAISSSLVHTSSNYIAQIVASIAELTNRKPNVKCHWCQDFPGRLRNSILGVTFLSQMI